MSPLKWNHLLFIIAILLLPTPSASEDDDPDGDPPPAEEEKKPKFPQIFIADADDIRTLYETEGINILNPDEENSEHDKPPDANGESHAPDIIRRAMNMQPDEKDRKPPNCPLGKTKFFFVKPREGKRIKFKDCFTKGLDYWKKILNSEQFKNLQAENHATQKETLKRPITIVCEKSNNLKVKLMFKAIKAWLSKAENADSIDALVFFMKGGGSKGRKKRYQKYVDVYLRDIPIKRGWITNLFRLFTFRRKKKT